MFRILQIDGGGIKGILPAIICEELERITRAPICKTFDLISGTSTGAILGGLLAFKKSAESIRKLYAHDGPRLFTPRGQWNPRNWVRPKYDRAPFESMLNDLLGDSYLFEANCEIMATAFGLCANRTHFVKSWNRKDQMLLARKVIAWSALSAARYFGKISAPCYKWSYEMPNGLAGDRVGEVFQDGGQGNHNCTLAYCLTEVFARGLDKEGPVTILSLGTGDHDTMKTYDDAADTRYFEEIIRFPFQARTESSINQIMAARYISANRKNVKVIRINVSLSADSDKLDAVRHINEFMEMGLKIVESEWFRRSLVPLFV